MTGGDLLGARSCEVAETGLKSGPTRFLRARPSLRLSVSHIPGSLPVTEGEGEKQEHSPPAPQPCGGRTEPNLLVLARLAHLGGESLTLNKHLINLGTQGFRVIKGLLVPA